MKIPKYAFLLLLALVIGSPLSYENNSLPENHFISRVQFSPHSPIIIDGNEEFAYLAEIEGWIGDGSITNPYIIENLEINGTKIAKLIDISNTDVYFQIRNCQFKQGHIKLYRVMHGTLTGNSILNCSIEFFHSDSNSFTSNIVYNEINHEGLPYILEFIYSGQSIVRNNEITNRKGGGIQFYYSGESTINYNILRQNTEEGIRLRSTGNCTLSHNVFENCDLQIEGEEVEHWLQMEVINNTLDGKPILFRQQQVGQLIDGGEAKQIFLVNCISIVVRNQIVVKEINVAFSLHISIYSNLINGGKRGIYLQRCYDSTISDNTIINNIEFGIFNLNSDGSDVIDNNILQNNTQGLYLDNVQGGEITNNVINDGGIILRGSSGTILRNNELWETGLFMEGEDLTHYIQTEVVNNSLNGKALIYWHSVSGGSVPANAGQIILVECTLIQVRNQNAEVFGAYSSQITIEENEIQDSSQGIYLIHSNNVKIIENQIINTLGPGIYMEFSENSQIEDNIVKSNQGKGIYLYYSGNGTLRNNTATDNAYEGISLRGCETSKVINNVADNNGGRGIYVGTSDGGQSSSNTEVTRNTVTNNDREGIIIEYSPNSNISNNLVTKNNVYGISAIRSGNNIIKNNILENNYFDLSSYQYEDYVQQEMTNNTIDGARVLYWRNVSDANVPSDVEQIILLGCKNVNVTNLEMGGIIGVECTGLVIEYNMITRGGDGISLKESDNNVISENYLINLHGRGIYLIGGSDQNIITHNQVMNVSHDGIVIGGFDGWYWRAVNNSLLNNTVTISRGRGIVVGEWTACSDCGGHALFASNCTIIDNKIINNNGIGMEITSDLSEYYGNLIVNNNGFGIHFQGALENMLSGNVIANNIGYAVYTNGIGVGPGGTVSSEKNSLMYNNFINNNLGGDTQACDNEFENIFSNNYWNEWITPDENEDGIVDNPYQIAGTAKNWDHYPLVSPYNLSEEHIFFPPRILFPNGNEILKGSVTISWTPAFDTHYHSVEYTVFYSKNAGSTWIEIKSGIKGNECNWNVETLTPGAYYMVKVVASCSEGLYASDTSDDTFSIIRWDETNPSTSTASDPHHTTHPFGIVMLTLILIIKRRRNRKVKMN